MIVRIMGEGQYEAAGTRVPDDALLRFCCRRTSQPWADSGMHARLVP